MKTTLTYGSLFAGIGGFDLGFERAGIKTIFQVELDAYCRRVLERHFPNALRFGDIRECCGLNCCDPGRWRDGEPCCQRKHHLPYVDILSGGFPCQDISNAGKRAGIDGARSGLWSEYARIIRELRPRYVVVENVAALLGRGFSRVVGDLAACGYDAEWQSIRASDVGAPHRRERIWIVAYPGREHFDVQQPLQRIFQSTRSRENLADAAESRCTSGPRGEGVAGQCEGRLPESDGRSSDVADAERDGREQVPQIFRRWESFATAGGENFSNNDGARLAQLQKEHSTAAPSRSGIAHAADWWATEPDVGRVAHGVPARVDRLRGIGNAIVPQIAEFIGRKIVEADEAEKMSASRQT